MKRFLVDYFTGKHAKEQRYQGWYTLLLVVAMGLMVVGYYLSR